jgi:Gluconate 2-dehydrogenase subunit 3
MSDSNTVSSDEATLAALARGIIPADEIDEGADSVGAGHRLASKLSSGPTADVYRRGIGIACEIARRRYGVSVAGLDASQIHDLLAAILEEMPAFFRQLRLDVSAMYLSDPQVWQRIGFPGPSTDKGGYPNFDQRPSSEVER